ncbi:MAG: hypothetical protein Q8Q05_01620 [bacterium]|nr:hypothetical protein [bacterium]
MRKRSSQHCLAKSKAASALLLTVMIIAILTTTTLASIAVRFDQLASTDKVANATVAKSAADSALVKLKEKLAASATITPTTFDLDKNEETASISTPFRPSPRKIVSTYQKISTSLPRCNGVIVLLPWTNDGQYLQNQANDTNPAMIFNYANIVNDTPLGIIPGNGGLDPTDKAKTVSQLTNMGHFYNPFAPVGAKQKDLNYWTVKLGGPQDQFLTKKDTDGASSFYKNVDFVYLPYLPRWSDSGLFSALPQTKVDRVSAATLQTKFETIIKENNFKVWLDASITDAQLYQYGFGDLFVDSPDYKLKWLQPSLWNDTPEADDLSTPYKTEDAENATLTWTKKTQPLRTTADNGWKTSIVKGAKSFSFIKLTTNETFSAGDTRSGSIYGSLEGLRLNQSITLLLLDKNQQPLSLQSRGQDQGRLYNVKLTKIGPITISNGIESVGITFKLGNDAYSTPPKPGAGGVVTGNDIDTIVVLAPPQFSTANSINSVNIAAPIGNSTTITLAPSSACQTACPAVGDLVSLTKPSAPSTAPIWGKVTTANYGNGTSFDGFTVDKLRQSPLPTREMAYTSYADPLDGNKTKIAYYGGAVNMNDYDGGYVSESDQLWIYDPEADTWTFKAPGVTNPGRRAGASMVYDSVNQRLVMIGGYFHQPININTSAIDCETAQPTCLYTNRPGLRVAKRVTNDVYAFNLTTNTWEKIIYDFTGKKIVTGQQYTVRVTSTLADRSGLERWNWTAKSDTGEGQTQTLYVDGNESTIDLIYPSAAGIAKGDEVYIYGNKTDNLGGGNFYAWAKVNSVLHQTNTIGLTVYGYKPAGGETLITMKTLAIQVVKRQITTDTCLGGIDPVTSKYFCQFSSGADTIGYAVGDSVVLEQYAGDGSALNGTLSGFINYIDPSGKAYFVSDETKSAIADFTDLDQNRAIAASDSAVAFPSARYGATLAIQPANASLGCKAGVGGTPSCASYWEGAAKNINYNMRFADLWNVQFVAGSGAASVAWLPQSIANDTTGLSGTNSYRFQVIKSNYSYQIPTSASTANNPEIIKVTQIDPKTGDSIVAWDNNQRWQLEIASTDASKVVTGAWATLERRLSDGTRETFHGIVENTYSGSNGVCAAYTDTRLCLRHNSSFPNDSGFAGNSAGVKVTMSPAFSTADAVGGIFGVDIAGGKVTLQNVQSANYGRVPGLGAMVMIWRDQFGATPTDAYTFIVKDRTFSSGSSTFNIFFDKIIASPHPFSYSSSQIASSQTVSNGPTIDRLVTIADHQTYFDLTNAPEWVKDATSNNAWKIRLAAKNPTLLYRPSPRRAGTVATIFTPGNSKGVFSSSKFFMTGGTFGQYGSLWKQENAGATATIGGASWTPQYVSANSASDIPNLFGGSMVAYKFGGLTKLVYFGGKQKTDISSADYGGSIGAKMLGRPDNGAYIDNSYFVIDNAGTADLTALSLTNTIITNKSSSWPSGVDNSLKFKGSNRDGKTVCAYIGQVGCTSEELLSQLGNMGRLDDLTSNETYNGWTWGRTAILTELGDRFKSQNSSTGLKASLIMSIPTLSGSGVNGRWDQDGYRPYCKDNAAGGCLNLGAASAYGKLGTDFGSDKTAGLVAYSAINNAEHKGGAILATSVGVGNAIASSRGGVTGTKDGWYSYCAASDLKKTDGVPDLNSGGTAATNGTYICQSSATRYLPTLPDAEDLLFMLNAAQALGATDTYKVVGYYGGVKRGYLVTSVSGTLPKVYEIVP